MIAAQSSSYLITGGAGFIGSHVTKALLEAGKTVTVVDNLSTGKFENIQPFVGQPGFRFAIESVMNETVLDRLASEAEIIVHLAAAVGVQLVVERPVHTIETNVFATERVLKVALRYRAKVVMASTSEVYGKGNAIPFSEDDDILLGPSSKSRWAYAASKLTDEFLALAYQREFELPVVILRLFNTVGPRQTGRYGMVIPRFMNQALAGEALTVYGDGNQRRCFCDVRDAVKAITLLADDQRAIGRVFNVGSTEEIAINELAKRVIAITASSSKIKHVPYSDAYAPGFEDMMRRVPDITRINSLCGWKPTIPLDETLCAVRDHVKGSASSD